MHRQILVLIILLLSPVSMLAEDSLPIVEIKADRTMIYPQRMELMGEESLMDVLQMVPELMIGGYEDVLSSYNLRIDNCPMNGDTRLILSQMKAKDIAKIQVCDNTGVAKGTIGMGRVLDINMKMPDALNGFVEGEGDFGRDFTNANTLFDEEWARAKGLLKEWDINQVKLAYAIVGAGPVPARHKLTVQTEASYCIVEDGENFTELGASVYWKTKGLSLAGGSNLYTAKSGTYASFRFAPTAYLPHAWQIGLQMVYFTKKMPMREVNGTPAYGCLSVNKQLGRRWNMGIDWHDMFDAFCSDVVINRHAANIKLQYRF